MNLLKELFSDQSPQAQPIEQKAQFEDVLRRLVLAQSGSLGSFVNPDSCMKSPTVHAIVTAISRRLAITPVHVYQKSEVDGKDTKQKLGNHPIEKLLRMPNQWQSSYDFWQDAGSTIVRHGRFYSYKSGFGGSRKELLPLDPKVVEPKQDEKTWQVTYKVTTTGDQHQEYKPSQMFAARGPARDFLKGDSTVTDVNVAIGLEILAETFGANFFKNGALPLMIFKYAEGSAGFETKEQEEQFLADVKEAFGGSNQLSSMLVPKGIDMPDTLSMEHDKAQFLETRQYQRTVIAGAFGVPPHLTGDLSRGTFNNVEQQDKDFTLNVILPYVRCFESSMERDLLSEGERDDGIVIRFNMDADLRASFKERQEGLQIQRSNGIISANEWREMEGKNPRTDDEGDDYLHPGNMMVDGEIQDEPDETAPNDIPGNQEPE